MWIHKYSLHALEPLNAKSAQTERMGFFIKDQEKITGDDPVKNFLKYSDYIYWPELGDPEIKDLKPFLMKQAERDFQYPFSLTDADLQPVKSNALVNSFTPNLGEDLEKFKEAGFDTLKFKMGRSFETEYKSLMKMNLSHFLLRVDFNGVFNFKESKEVLEMLKKVPNLEYAEDPTPYHDYYWSELQKITPLALDSFTETKELPKHFQYRIIKPIRGGFKLDELLQLTYEKKKIVLTNMMDNVVGAWKLYFYYCELKKHIPYHLATPGFHTHKLYADYELEHFLGFDGALWTFDKAKDSDKLCQLTKTLSALTWLELKYTDSLSLDKILKDTEAYR